MNKSLMLRAGLLVLATGFMSLRAGAADLPNGKAIYDASCVACHSTGAAGAPKLGDAAAWAPRVKAGAPALYTSAIKGKGAMPAKGGNPKLSDADVRAAVNYMISQSEGPKGAAAAKAA
ncbi:MAG TPA: c-type cytochrome, partial [Noviherbaspirillum sp.]